LIYGNELTKKHYDYTYTAEDAFFDFVEEKKRLGYGVVEIHNSFACKEVEFSDGVKITMLAQ
jgi:hypothetical protein